MSPPLSDQLLKFVICKTFLPLLGQTFYSRSLFPSCSSPYYFFPPLVLFSLFYFFSCTSLALRFLSHFFFFTPSLAFLLNDTAFILLCLPATADQRRIKYLGQRRSDMRTLILPRQDLYIERRHAMYSSHISFCIPFHYYYYCDYIFCPKLHT